MRLYTVPYQNNFCCKWYLAIITTSIITSCLKGSYSIKLCLRDVVIPSLLFKNIIIAEKMLELETLFK